MFVSHSYHVPFLKDLCSSEKKIKGKELAKSLRLRRTEAYEPNGCRYYNRDTNFGCVTRMSWTPPRHSRGKWRNGPRKRKERYVGGGSLDIAMTRASSNNDDNMKDNARVKKKKQLLAALSSRPEMGTKGKEGRKCKRQERERMMGFVCLQKKSPDVWS